MLVSNVKNGDVVTMKLVTGEEVIGKFVSQNSTTVEINKLRSLGRVMDEKGQQHSALYVFQQLADDEVNYHLNLNTVVAFPVPAADVIKNLYNSEFEEQSNIIL